MLKEIRIGVSLVIITAVISGLANFYNKFAMKILAVDSFQYTTLKNAIVALIISAIVLTPWILPKLKKLTKKDWLNLAIIGLVGGSVPFLLFFKGLSLTSSVSASFIHKTLFFWVAILAWPFLREKISKLQFLALGILLLGNVIFESFRGLSWGLPETLILAATLLWAIETVIAKKVLANLDSIVLAWGRMFFGAIILFGFLFFIKDTAGIFQLNLLQIQWLLLASGLLAGYVITWYSALKKLPATVVTCFLVLASPITTFLNSIFVTHKLASQNVWGMLIILAGVLLFFKITKAKNNNIQFSISNFH